MPKGVYDHSKIIPWNKGLLGYRAGMKHSVETKKKIADAHRGMKHTDETKQKLSKYFKGRPIKQETKDKIRETMLAKFIGIEPDATAEEIRRIRRSNEYAEWRLFVLKRDNYTCVLCGEDDESKLTVDHIKPLRLYPELATEPSNGRVVCNKCHVRLPTHGRYSRANG